MCFVEENFASALAAEGIQVDKLKTDVNLSAVGPYYLGVNLTDSVTVSISVRLIFTVL